MDTEEKILDLVFHRLSPERFFNALFGAEDFKTTFESAFRAAAESTLRGYSGNEQELFYQSVVNDIHKSDSENFRPPFHLLFQYGEKTLRDDAGSLACRFERLLNWRELFLQLGQDIIITAWLAKQSVLFSRHPKSFAWPPVIASDNTVLNKMLAEGLAENHYHLYGSAAIFPISWARTMTYPRIILNKGNEWLEFRLQMGYSRGSADNLWTTRKRLIYAAYIRSLLFSRLRSIIDDGAEAMERLRSFDREYFTDDQIMIRLNREVEQLRLAYGIAFEQPGHKKSACLDYAFTSELSADINSDCRILAGERHLLFQCFAAGYSGEFDFYMQWLFYIYLLLKSTFRSEMIQSNQQTGFYNFLQYELRKRNLWQMAAYHNEAYKTAINAVLGENKVSSLELRVSPDNTKRESSQKIYRIDRAKLFYDGEDMPVWRDIESFDRDWEKEAFFYVFHFVKEEDPVRVGPDDVYVSCRHEKQREDYKRQAVALARALSDYDYLCKRIRGIDACANEVTCRPENFACAFRFLRGFSPEYYRRSCTAALAPRLSVSYHVGEDFWDIADGLRAIDEAIGFLHLQRGDRLGHALALGVEPRLHYAMKSRQIILPKQNLLDNYVWLYFRCAELNVFLPPELKQRIHTQAETLFHDLYDEALGKNHPASLSDYYHAWLLRGDDPEKYKSGFIKTGMYCGIYDFFALNESIPDIDIYRANDRVAKIYSCYHYSTSVRRKGSQTTIFEITDAYISLMEKVQDVLQQHVSTLGISIECNPSSNVLIGTFKEYQHHPILRFHKVFPDTEDHASQMHVSINTDDQGIFGTSLPFEYALLAAALTNETDEDGNRRYSDAEIKKYLGDIRQMGQEQIFPAVCIM